MRPPRAHPRRDDTPEAHPCIGGGVKVKAGRVSSLPPLHYRTSEESCSETKRGKEASGLGSPVRV